MFLLAGFSLVLRVLYLGLVVSFRSCRTLVLSVSGCTSWKVVLLCHSLRFFSTLVFGCDMRVCGARCLVFDVSVAGHLCHSLWCSAMTASRCVFVWISLFSLMRFVVGSLCVSCSLCCCITLWGESVDVES